MLHVGKHFSSSCVLPATLQDKNTGFDSMFASSPYLPRRKRLRLTMIHTSCLTRLTAAHEALKGDSLARVLPLSPLTLARSAYVSIRRHGRSDAIAWGP